MIDVHQALAVRITERMRGGLPREGLLESEIVPAAAVIARDVLRTLEGLDRRWVSIYVWGVDTVDVFVCKGCGAAALSREALVHANDGEACQGGAFVKHGWAAFHEEGG